jgi:hypothetical protein
MALFTFLRGGVLISFLFSLLFSSVLDTIKSYQGFAYQYSFVSPFLKREGKGSGYCNLLTKREERVVISWSKEGKVKSYFKGGGDWEYVKRKGWERRPRSEDSDIIRVLEILLLEKPEFGETIFKPNLCFLGDYKDCSKGRIRYQKGRVSEIICWDSVLGTRFDLRLERINRLKEISLPFSPAQRLVLSFRQEGWKPLLSGAWGKKGRGVKEIIERRLSSLGINCRWKRKGKMMVLEVDERLEEDVLNLVFAAGIGGVYLGDSLVFPGESLSVSLSPRGILFELPRGVSLLREEGLALKIDGTRSGTKVHNLSFPLTVDIRGDDGKIKVLRLELIGKKKEILFSVLKEKLPYPVEYEVKND